MFQGIEPPPFLFGNVFRDDIPQLFDQRQLPVFRIIVAEQVEARQFYLLLKRRHKPSRPPFHIRLERARMCHFALQSEFRFTRKTFQARQHSIQSRRPWSPESGVLFTRALHGFLP